MSFTIDLYTTTSEVNRIRKTLTSVSSLTGALREESSLMTPVIMIEANAGSLAHVNYAYIQEFGRYYFIEDVKSIHNNLVEVTMRCDVLMTYADEILENTAIIGKQESEWNLYLNDGTIQVYNNPNIITKSFPNGFTTESFVLAVAGSVQSAPSQSGQNS